MCVYIINVCVWCVRVCGLAPPRLSPPTSPCRNRKGKGGGRLGLYKIKISV